MPAPQELFAPYWTLEPGWATDLEVRNNVPWHDLTITPVLRTADGSEVPLAPVHLRPEGIVLINLKDAVAAVKPALLGRNGSFGSVVFRFNATDAANGFAAAMVRREGHPIDFHFDADDDGSNAAEGIWWVPSESSTDYLIVSNPTGKPAHGKLTFSDASGSSKSLSLTVGPGQSVRTSIRDVLGAQANGSFGGLSLSSTGSLLAAQIVFDEVSGLGAIMKLFERQSLSEADTVENRVLRAPMMALSQPDSSLEFPSGTVLDPKIFLRNVRSTTLVVTPAVNWHSDTAAGTSSLPAITLSPGQISLISLADFQRAGKIPPDAPWGTLTLGFKGRTGDIVAVAMSYDATNRYGLQTPFSEEMNHLFKGSMWHVDDSHNSIITTGNGGTGPTKAQVTLFYDANGIPGKYRVEKTLLPGQQIWLNLGDLLHNQVPDSDGKTMPPDLMFGSYELRDLGHPVLGLLYEGKLVIDKTYGHASYGCSRCCGYSRAQLFPTQFSGPPGADTLDIYQEMDACTSTWYNDDVASNSQSTNPSVATLVSLLLHPVSPGTATTSAKNSLPYGSGRSCPNVLLTGTQSVTVTACPTSMSVDQITPKTLPDYDQPTWLTGVGILARMKVGPATSNYTGVVLSETVTPSNNSCPSNIQQYTSFPTVTAADHNTFTIGDSAIWEGQNFTSVSNAFYDSHRNLVNIDVLGLTTVQSCVATAVQTYFCNGSNIGTFTLTNTYTRGTLNGQHVTNVSTTKQ